MCTKTCISPPAALTRTPPTGDKSSRPPGQKRMPTPPSHDPPPPRTGTPPESRCLYSTVTLPTCQPRTPEGRAPARPPGSPFHCKPALGASKLPTGSHWHRAHGVWWTIGSSSVRTARWWAHLVLSFGAASGVLVNDAVLAVVKDLQGRPELQLAGTGRCRPLVTGAVLQPGDQIRTDARSRVRLESGSTQAHVSVGKSSRVEILDRDSRPQFRIVRTGFFASIESLWMHQHNSKVYPPDRPSPLGPVVALPSEDLWQLNVWGGWRFLRRRAEILVGVLNVTDADYRLNPINLTAPPERERTFIARLSFHY